MMFIISLAARGDTIAKCAEEQIGKPYVFGSRGPNTFDTTGLIMYCYAKVGISLPPTVTSICEQGRQVEFPKPGDIFC